MNDYDILYHDGLNILNLYKKTKDKVVTKTKGNYGVVHHRNIRNNVIKIEIPEPDFLLSLSIDDLKRF